MAFVRSKIVAGHQYYQLVENYRQDGKHRQRVLAHLGKHATLGEAIDDAAARVDLMKKAAREDRVRAHRVLEGYARRHPEKLDQDGRPPCSHARYWGCLKRADEALREAARLEERYRMLRKLCGDEQAFDTS